MFARKASCLPKWSNLTLKEPASVVHVTVPHAKGRLLPSLQISDQCGLYYKSFTIVNCNSVWRVSYDRNLQSYLRQPKASLKYDRSFIVLATVITIVKHLY